MCVFALKVSDAQCWLSNVKLTTSNTILIPEWSAFSGRHITHSFLVRETLHHIHNHHFKWWMYRRNVHNRKECGTTLTTRRVTCFRLSSTLLSFWACLWRMARVLWVPYILDLAHSHMYRICEQWGSVACIYMYICIHAHTCVDSRESVCV